MILRYRDWEMHSGHKSGAQSQQRVVRVYISSTFRDMRDERSELVRSAYSELRRRCKERGIEFVDVDLRRGMPDDKKAEEHILPLCFAEIERSSPYFIGLLGERYGRVPDEIDRELAATLPWLNEHHEQSVTELEIIHGVLNNPEAEKRAFFYFRDPRKSLEIEDGLRKEKDYEPEPQAFLERLDRLKNEILKHESDYPVPVRRDFIDAKALARLVVDDLWNDIDKTYPIGDVPTPLERERMAHEAFAEERSSIYVGRDEYFKTLDKHVESDSPPLVLLGESGCG